MNANSELCDLPETVDDLLRRVVDAGEAGLPESLDAANRLALAVWVLELLGSPERLRDFGVCVSSLLEGDLLDLPLPSAATLRRILDSVPLDDGPSVLFDSQSISDAELLRLALNPVALGFLSESLDARPLPEDAGDGDPGGLCLISCELTPLPVVRAGGGPSAEADSIASRTPPVFAAVATKMGDTPVGAASVSQWERQFPIALDDCRRDWITPDGPPLESSSWGNEPATVTVQVLPTEVQVALEGFLQPGQRDVVSVAWRRGASCIASTRAAGQAADIVELKRPLEEDWLPGDTLRIELLRSLT